jgi:hypothetical protein
VIVVEGPDGAGKTTLIETLSDLLDLPVAPRVVSKDAEAMVNLVHWTERNVTEGFQPIIYDRHRLISEPIYGPILREYPEPGFDDPMWLYEMNTKFYNFCTPVIIYCLPPVVAVINNIESDPDNRVVKSSIERIYALYANKAATELVHRPLHTFWYDYTSAAYRDDIIRAIEKRVTNVQPAN